MVKYEYLPGGGHGNRHHPPTEAALLGFDRAVAGRAVEVATILGLDNPKAFGDALNLHNPRKLILRRKHGNAVLLATTAHKILDPMFAGHLCRNPETFLCR